MNFQTIVWLGQAYFVSFAIGLGIAASLKKRRHKVVTGVAVCLGTIVIGEAFTIWFYNHASDAAYLHHLMRGEP